MNNKFFKQEEENTEKNDKWFRAIFEQAPVGIALIDLIMGHIYEVNQKFADIIGMTIAELYNIEWISITHPDDIQEELNNMALLKTGQISSFNMIKRLLLPSGSIIWINMKIALVVNNDKEHLRHLCMIEDISECKCKQVEAEKENIASELKEKVQELAFENQEKAERAAELIIANKELAFQNQEKAERAAELIIANEELAYQNREKAERAAELIIANDYLENLINYANAPIIVLNPQYLITHFNHAVEFITGRCEKEVLGKSLDILFPPDKVSKSMKYFENLKDEKHWETLEMEIIHVDGSVRTLLWNSATIYDADGITPGSIIAQGQDITDRIKSEEEILYLGYHDQLTGLYNRRFYEEELKRLDTERNLPLTIVMGDVNGLKLINDSFGHSIGDELLKKVAEVIRLGCRAEDIIARLGGDEFVILLPKTDAYEAEEIIKHITEMSLSEKVGSVDISISFGFETKNNKKEDIQEIFKNAEDHMYEKKLFESPSMRGKTIKAIINTLHEKNKREEQHSHRVSELCKSMGEALGLHEHENEVLKSVGLLHDIGKIAIDENVLNKPSKLTKDEWKEIKRHPEIGFRILNTVNDMSEMANYVLYHHERWDGKGYPKGLKEKEIPFVSRIIAIADAYDAMTSERSYRSALPEEVVIEELEKNAGIQFDPKLVSVFIENVLGKRMIVV